MILADVPESYLTLICRFPLRPIRSEEAYAEASRLMTELAVRGENDLDCDELDYLDALSTLMEAYQAERGQEIPRATPTAILKHLMEQRQVRAVALADRLGITEAAMSMILNGKRHITADHARGLGDFFHLDPGVFI